MSLPTSSIVRDPDADRDARDEDLSDMMRDEDRDGLSGERFGAGVCVTGRCAEPCGQDGGCKR